MAGNPKKKSTGIVNAAISALAVVLAILIVWMMNLVAGIQGTARIINYAGPVSYTHLTMPTIRLV